MKINLHQKINSKFKVNWSKANKEYQAIVTHWPHIIGRGRTVEEAIIHLTDMMKGEAEKAVIYERQI